MICKSWIIDFLSPQWAEDIVASCPSSLRRQISSPLDVIHTTLQQVISAYKTPISDLVPRPALLVFAHTAAALYLLEHAVWAHKLHEPTHDTDVEVFRRWVEEAGLAGLCEELKLARSATPATSDFNSKIVYGEIDCEKSAKAHL